MGTGQLNDNSRSTAEDVSPRRRIAFIGPQPNARGGIAQFQAHLAASLNSDCETRTIAFRRLYPRWTKAGRQEPDPSEQRLRILSHPVLTPWFPWTWLRGSRQLRTFRPDVVVVQWWHPLFAPCLRFLASTARKSGALVLFVCHNAEPHEPFPFSRALTRLALRTADGFIALSDTVAAKLARIAPSIPCHVLRHPVFDVLQANGRASDREYWRQRLRNLDGRVVLFFGNVRAYKGLADLLAALPAVRARVPVTLVVAGTFFESLKRYVRMAAHLGVSDSVRFIPEYVPNERVAGLFERADVVVLPYRSASQSGIIPQALAFGCRVVTTDVVGNREAVGEGGIIVPAGDVAALGEGVVRALSERPVSPALPAADWQAWRRAIVEPVTRRRSAKNATRQRLGRVFLPLLGWAIVAYFLAGAVLAAARDVSHADVSIKPVFIVASTALLMLSGYIGLLAWHVLLRGVGATVPLHRSARILTSAQLVRFLPLGMLHYVARYRFGVKAGVTREAILTATAIDLALRLGAAVLVFGLSLPFWPSLPESVAWIPVPVVVLLLALLHPVPFHAITRLIRKTLGAENYSLEVRYRAVALASLLLAGAFVMNGLAAYLVAVGITELPPQLALPLVGALTISWAIGVLTPFAPGGLGVREAVGASLLRTFMTSPAALLVVIVTRIQTIAVELTTAWLCVAWDVLARGRTRVQGKEKDRATTPPPSGVSASEEDRAKTRHRAVS